MVAQYLKCLGKTLNPWAIRPKYRSPANLKLKAEARYYTPKATSWAVGPCPRAWDKPQNIGFLYKLTILPTPLTALNFLPPLPEGVSFTGKQSVTIGPEIKYDAGSKTVAWNYNLIPVNSQTGLYFEVAATPTAGQAGRNLNLTGTLNFTAMDDFVNQKLC